MQSVLVAQSSRVNRPPPRFQAKPPVPAEATGYVGGLEGTVKEKAPQNAWLVLSVSKAEPDAKSKVKDGSLLVG